MLATRMKLELRGRGVLACPSSAAQRTHEPLTIVNAFEKPVYVGAG